MPLDADLAPLAEAGPTGRAGGGVLPLIAEGLCFEAGGRRLIDDLHVRIDAGVITAILGPNGAGKSLLLRLLSGLITPSAGQVTWAGLPACRAVRARLAMVFQRPVMLRRSVAGNLRYALATRRFGPGERRRRLERALHLARLTALADRPARLLSGGEQQRLAIARAMSLEPDVLFLDEPAAHLDPASTLAVEALLRTAHAGGTTVVLVTHDIGQARRLAGSVAFLHEGRLLDHQPAPAFFAGPACPEARSYLDGRLVL